MVPDSTGVNLRRSRAAQVTMVNDNTGDHFLEVLRRHAPAGPSAPTLLRTVSSKRSSKQPPMLRAPRTANPGSSSSSASSGPGTRSAGSSDRLGVRGPRALGRPALGGSARRSRRGSPRRGRLSSGAGRGLRRHPDGAPPGAPVIDLPGSTEPADRRLRARTRLGPHHPCGARPRRSRTSSEVARPRRPDGSRPDWMAFTYARAGPSRTRCDQGAPRGLREPLVGR